MSEKREVVFYSCDNRYEHLSCKDPDEAIEMALDDWNSKLFRVREAEITVYGFARIYPTIASCGSPLELLLETLDENYGNPDGPEDPTDVMRKVEKVFLATVLAEYIPWTCEQVEAKTVNVADWVRKNRPDWLEETDT